MIVNPDIFRSYDIRGIYNRDFDASFAEEFGNKVALALQAKTLVIGRDRRVSSDALEKALVQGVILAGVRVLEIGECTTPSFYYSVHAKQSEGGIMITASHNPQEYNGFKVVGPDGNIIGGDQLRMMYLNTASSRAGTGAIEAYDGIGEYAKTVSRIGGSGENTFVVGVNGPRANEKILNKIGEKTALLIQKSNGSGLEVSFDGDADRISFFDRRKKIDADFIALLIIMSRGYKKIIHDFRCSRAVREQFEKLGITAIPSKVGRLNVYENMKNYDADFGFEITGHFYLKDFNYLESPETVLLWVRQIIQKEGKNLEELIKPYDRYFRSGELSYPLNSRAFALIKERYADGRINRDDGILVEYDDWWFNLRASNTEPVMRLIVEAQNRELLNRKVQELEGMLRN